MSRAQLILTVTFACLCGAGVVPAWAQAWQGGVKTGISRVGSASDEFAWSGSSSSAVFVRRHVAGPVAIQGELSHVRRSGASNLPTSTLRMVADYVEIPLLLHAAYRAGSVAPFVTAGPTIGLRLRCRLQFLGGGLSTDDDCESQQGTRSHRLDVGVVGGAGLAWDVGSTTLSVESRVTAGLRPFVLPTDVSDAQSLGWSAYAGISIPLSRRGRRAPSPSPASRHVTLSMLPAPLPVGSDPSAFRLEAPNETRIRLAVDNANVRDVLLAVAARGGIRLVLPDRIDIRITAALQDVAVSRAIHGIADVAGLDVLPSTTAGGPIIILERAARGTP